MRRFTREIKLENGFNDGRTDGIRLSTFELEGRKSESRKRARSGFGQERFHRLRGQTSQLGLGQQRSHQNTGRIPRKLPKIP